MDVTVQSQAERTAEDLQLQIQQLQERLQSQGKEEEEQKQELQQRLLNNRESFRNEVN